MSTTATKAPKNGAQKQSKAHLRADGLLKQYAKLEGQKTNLQKRTKAKVAEIDQQLETLKNDLRAFAEVDRDQWGTAKSLRLAGGAVGFRLNPGKLSFGAEKYDEEKFIQFLEENLPLVVSRTFDAKAVIREITNHPDEFGKGCADLGVSLVKDETFYVTADA